MRYPALVLILLAACSQGAVLFDGPVHESFPTSHARLVRLEDGRLAASVRLIGDSRSPPERHRFLRERLAEHVVGRVCSHGSEKLSAVPATRSLGGTEVELSERSLWRCLPDPRSPEEIRAARDAVLTRPHPCGIHPNDFVPGYISRC